MPAPVVLIVEDEAMVAEIIARAIAMHAPGCDIVRAASGEEGLTHCEALLGEGRVITGIMVDHGLPGMHGGDFLEEVANLCAQRQLALPPAVYMSGYDLQSEGAAPAYATLEFLCKPFSLADIAPLMRSFFNVPA